MSSLHVQILQLVEHLVAVGPDVELPRELGDDEVRLPAAQLLRLEDVAEDVVAEVEDVLALRPDHLGQHITRACTKSTSHESKKGGHGRRSDANVNMSSAHGSRS